MKKILWNNDVKKNSYNGKDGFSPTANNKRNNRFFNSK